MDVSMTLSVISIVLSGVSMIFGILGFSFALAAKMSTHRVQYVDPFKDVQNDMGWATSSETINDMNEDIAKTERAYDEDNLMEMI